MPPQMLDQRGFVCKLFPTVIAAVFFLAGVRGLVRLEIKVNHHRMLRPIFFHFSPSSLSLT
jgi:hypothetical protein